MTWKRLRDLSPSPNRICWLVLCWGLLAVTAWEDAGAQVYVQGLPTVGNNGSSNAAASQMSIDATQFGAVGDDMCKKISLACAALNTPTINPVYPKGATIDARGFTGNQVCSASTATTMLNGCVTGTNHNGGKLLLGNVNLYIDGPVPPATSYTDGSSGVGTPAIIIPSMFWGIEGISRGATANGTNAGLGTFISPCPTTNPPTGCNPTTHPFPVRSFQISTNTVSGMLESSSKTGMSGVGDWIGQGYWEELSPRAA